MEAVAEAVMDMQAILLGNKTNVDKLEMWNIKGQYSLESQVFAFILSSCCLWKNSRSCNYKFDCDTCDAACVCPAILKMMCVTVKDSHVV